MNLKFWLCCLKIWLFRIEIHKHQKKSTVHPRRIFTCSPLDLESASRMNLKFWFSCLKICLFWIQIHKHKKNQPSIDVVSLHVPHWMWTTPKWWALLIVTRLSLAHFCRWSRPMLHWVAQSRHSSTWCWNSGFFSSCCYQARRSGDQSTVCFHGTMFWYVPLRRSRCRPKRHESTHSSHGRMKVTKQVRLPLWYAASQ